MMSIESRLAAACILQTDLQATITHLEAALAQKANEAEGLKARLAETEARLAAEVKPVTNGAKPRKATAAK